MTNFDNDTSSTAAPALTADAVREAMQDAWNNICQDTGCHPLDLTESPAGHIYFSPKHWADAVARILIAWSPPPSEDQHKRCTICGFVIDTSFAAEKPTADFTTRGRARKSPGNDSAPVVSKLPTEEEIKRAIRTSVNLDSMGCCELQFGEAAKAVCKLITSGQPQAGGG